MHIEKSLNSNKNEFVMDLAVNGIEMLVHKKTPYTFCCCVCHFFFIMENKNAKNPM